MDWAEVVWGSAPLTFFFAFHIPGLRRRPSSVLALPLTSPEVLLPPAWIGKIGRPDPWETPR